MIPDPTSRGRTRQFQTRKLAPNLTLQVCEIVYHKFKLRNRPLSPPRRPARLHVTSSNLETGPHSNLADPQDCIWQLGRLWHSQLSQLQQETTLHSPETTSKLHATISSYEVGQVCNGNDQRKKSGRGGHGAWKGPTHDRRLWPRQSPRSHPTGTRQSTSVA